MSQAVFRELEGRLRSRIRAELRKMVLRPKNMVLLEDKLLQFISAYSKAKESQRLEIYLKTKREVRDMLHV